MKVLFATHKDNDYIASCLWDGLQELLGEENVYDANGNKGLHANRHIKEDACNRISNSRNGRVNYPPMAVFDLLVLNSCFLRDYDWHWPWQLKKYLKPGAKIAYVEGWDDAHEVHNPLAESDPPFYVDAVFRREIDPRFSYPYHPHCLMMAAPRRWYFDGADRPYDVIFCGRAVDYENRWDVLGAAFRTKKHHHSIIASMGIEKETKPYFDRLREFKLGLAPPGAAGCGDCLRTWELVASGVIPILCGFPPKVREPWFADDEIFSLDSPAGLTELIDRALDMDLNAMRQRMQKRFLESHTTKARAERLLAITGV